MEEAEVSPGTNDATSKSRCCPVSQVTGHLEALSMNGEENDDSEEEILYAVGDYVGVGEDQLSFKRGEPLKILQKMSEHWWWAESKGNVGYIPVNHLTHNSFQQMCWQDDEYFGSYGKLKLHHEMLSDKPRTSAYQKAIKDNAHLMKDLVILDVGCGTGILSLMCAQYGQPKQVYAVEASDMADHTSEVVSSNHFSHVITVVHSYVEDLTLDQPVDLIISEWMGTLLLFEMMIESVLVARDKFLRPGGIVWPSAASLFLVPVSAAEQYSDSIDFWTAQYGFDLSCLKPLAFEEFLQKPNHSFILDRDNCLATETKLLELDISTLKVTGLEEMSRMFEFEITKSGMLHGFCTWFQVDFQGLAPEVETVSLNTGPDHDLTHWKQNLFLLDSGISVNEGDVLQGQAKIFRHSEWRRHLRFFVTFRHIRKQTGENVPYEKLFYVWR
ncbi:protein arginine N-methyltransferase 2-like isoform X2 [Littorina saxatilis]|uniref:protein arginine N-methyltransferase 2-like isoform X2 n=1 Tax=Littorina saxatilis TaxID=31220 RepID=UPI0038B5CE9C